MSCLVDLSHWQKVVVPQRNKVTGCIPTGYEWMIKYMNIKDVDFSRFQEEFDLGVNNSLSAVGEKIMNKYSHVLIEWHAFEEGEKKLTFIRGLLGKDVPCLISYPSYVSLAQCEMLFHIAPVVSVDDTKVRIVWNMERDNDQTVDLLISNLIWCHSSFTGGHEIAWLQARA